MTSDNGFYPKIIDTHEREHVDQWTNQALYSELYDVSKIYDLFKNESASFNSGSERAAWKFALESEVQSVITKYKDDCDDVADQTANCRELDAHALSNDVAPDFLEPGSGEYQSPSCPSPLPAAPAPTR